jgi:hypothetical protein
VGGLRLVCAGAGGQRCGPGRAQSVARIQEACYVGVSGGWRRDEVKCQQCTGVGCSKPATGIPRFSTGAAASSRRPMTGSTRSVRATTRTSGRHGSCTGGAAVVLWPLRLRRHAVGLGHGRAAASVVPLSMVLCRTWGREWALLATVLLFLCVVPAGPAPWPLMHRRCTPGCAPPAMPVEPLATNRWELLFCSPGTRLCSAASS